jgi:hypothetical protein
LYNASCNRIKETWWAKWNWTYTINPTWTESIQVYCDMTTDWGWWTLVHKTTDSANDLVWAINTTEWNATWDDDGEYRLSINYWKWLSKSKIMRKNIRIDGLSWNDIQSTYITNVTTSNITLSWTDTYYIFNWGASVTNCTSWTNYFNSACCATCVNYDLSATYWIPDNSPMLSVTNTSYTWSAIEWAWWTWDSSRHRMSKMGIFIK